MSSSDSSDRRCSGKGPESAKEGKGRLDICCDGLGQGGFVDRLEHNANFRAQEIRRGSLDRKKGQGFASRVTQEASLYEVRATDSTGRVAWYFVKVPRLKIVAFDIAMKRGAFDLADYGEIVESGYGEVIPKDVRERVLERFKIS